jgi:hypothetical protein
MRKSLLLALFLGLILSVMGALPLATTGQACSSPCGERLPNVAPIPVAEPPVEEEEALPPPTRPATSAARRGPPPVTETALVCVRRQVTAANPAALAEAIRRVQGAYECLPAGTRAELESLRLLPAVLAARSAELAAAQAEILHLRGLLNEMKAENPSLDE